MRKWYPLALVTLLLVLSVVAYPRLPDRVAIHFAADGTANGYAPRWEAMLLMPAILVFVWVVTNIVPRVDPRGDNYARMQPAYLLTVNAVLTFLALGQVAIIGHALGWPFAIERIIPAMVGALLIVIGNVLPQARPNWFFGIRTPWTLSNDRVWERTHRVGGYLLVGAGIISMLAVFLPLNAGLSLLLISVGAAALGAVAYSYVAWKEEISR